MEIKSGEVFKVIEGEYKGVFRVFTQDNKNVFLVVIECSSNLLCKPGPKKLSYNDAGELVTTNTTEVVIIKRENFEQLKKDQLIYKTDEYEISNDAKIYGSKNNIAWEKNIQAMQYFLDPIVREQSVGEHGDFSKLIHKTLKLNLLKKEKVYLLVKRMIMYGFNREALIPHSYKGGAPGVSRSEEAEKPKAGRKDNAHRLAIINNLPPEPEGFAMSLQWQKMVLAGVAKIPIPFPKFEKVYHSVLESEFKIKTKGPNGEKVTLLPAKGRYPTERQMRFFLGKIYKRDGRAAYHTTPFNREQNYRGTLDRSYSGIFGPGHTYAIDSTIADVNIVTSDRIGVLGRPVVYVVIDVWSSAIVGFYVCLSGPDWDSAKMALFCTAFDPEKLAKLRGSDYFPTFAFKPTLPKVLLSDRGEYLSQRAGYTSFLLQFDQDLTAPYRGDWKGIVEVQFHTIKDEIVTFIPGAHDLRRQEMELRKSKPGEAVMTLKEFTLHLESCFRQYNRTPVQEHRIPEGMKYQGIPFTPASLWDWGHQNHIGSGVYKSDEELIEELLPKTQSSISGKGISFNGRHYGDIDNSRDKFLAETANHGIKISVYTWSYPGNIDYVWTNDDQPTGLRQVPIHGGNFTFQTEQEYADSQIIVKGIKSGDIHNQTVNAVIEFGIRKDLRENAIAETKRALNNKRRKGKLNIAQNRAQELSSMSSGESAENTHESSLDPTYIQNQSQPDSGGTSHSQYFKDLFLGDDIVH